MSITIVTGKEYKEYYLADFLKTGAESVYINIHLPSAYKGKGVWAAEVGFYFENTNRINEVKALLDGIKLNHFDLDKKTCEEKAEFSLSDACPEFGMCVEFGDGRNLLIYVNARLKDVLGTNLSVQYSDYTENGNRLHKYFTGLIPDEARRAVIEWANFAFDEFVMNRQKA